MRYVFMAAHEAAFEVKRMCQALGVTRSGYYAWKQHPLSAREQANQELMDRIKIEFEHSRKTYGSPRIQAALECQGVGCSRKRVARLMQINGITPGKPHKRFPLTTQR